METLPNYGKKEILQICEDLAQKGDYETRDAILHQIKETDSELAVMQHNLIKNSLAIVVMCVGRLAYMAAQNFIERKLLS